MKKHAKRVIPLLLSFLLLFNLCLPPKKAHAFVPLAWLGWTAASIVADVAIDLGIKYVKKEIGKKASQNVTKKVLDNADEFDFTKSNGKKTKDNTIDIPVSSLDKQKIAKLWKEEALEVIEADKNRRTTKPNYDLDTIDTDPLYMTGLHLDLYPATSTSILDLEGVSYLRAMYDIHFIPRPYSRLTNVWFESTIDDTDSFGFGMQGGNPYKDVKMNVLGSTSSSRTYNWTIIDEQNDWTSSKGYGGKLSSMYDMDNVGGTSSSHNVEKTSKTYIAWQNYKLELAKNNRTSYMANGLVVNDNIKNIYDIPIDTPSGYDIGQNKPSDGLTIELPVELHTDDEFEITEANYHDYEQVIEKYIDDRDTQMDFSTTNYDYSQTIVNNYYTIDDGDKSQEEVDNEIIIIIDNDGGGNGNLPGETNKFTELIGTVAQQMKDVYTGFTGFLTVSVDGMKELSGGTVGLVTFFTGWFSFMPPEFTSLLGIAFMMGVFAHFFRR